MRDNCLMAFAWKIEKFNYFLSMEEQFGTAGQDKKMYQTFSLSHKE